MTEIADAPARNFTVEIGPTGRPIKLWLPAGVEVEESAMEQFRNLSSLPFVISHVAGMPDAHSGYGMPIGGVLFADLAVVPGAVGVDIGCGVCLIETNAYVDDLEDGDVLKVLELVSRGVPTGNGAGAQHEVADPNGDLFTKLLASEVVSTVALKALIEGEVQLGTLGGGNHFAELQRDEAGRLYFMIHSGSRSVGYKIGAHHAKLALGLNRKWHSFLPDDELAYLPWGTPEAAQYWTDMTVALMWAEENRRRMAAVVVAAFETVLSATARVTLDVHHNFAAWENHRGKNGIVHRKGAVRARKGETVLIPGSMGTASYVAEALGNPDAFDTCQHGAGRVRGRKATERLTTLAEMDKTLEEAGVVLVARHRAKTIDESPMAYKDIEAVMAASTDLVRPITRLLPLGVVKG